MRLFKNQVCFIHVYNSLTVLPHLSLIFLVPLIVPPLPYKSVSHIHYFFYFILCPIDIN